MTDFWQLHLFLSTCLVNFSLYYIMSPLDITVELYWFYKLFFKFNWRTSASTQLNSLFSPDRLRACGGVLTRNLTHLQSPSYPGTYIPDTTVSCAYTFTKVSPSLCTEPMITLSPGQHPGVPGQAGLCGVCDGASHQQHSGESQLL